MSNTAEHIILHKKLMEFLRAAPVNISAIEQELNIPQGQLIKASKGDSTCYKHVPNIIKYLKDKCVFDPEK